MLIRSCFGVIDGWLSQETLFCSVRLDCEGNACHTNNNNESDFDD